MFPCSHTSGAWKPECIRPANQTSALSQFWHLSSQACVGRGMPLCLQQTMHATALAWCERKDARMKWLQQCWQPVSSSPAGQHTVGGASGGVLGSCTGQLGDSGSTLAWQASRLTLSTVVEECRGEVGCALSMTGAMAVPTGRTGSEAAVHAPSRQAGRIQHGPGTRLLQQSRNVARPSDPLFNAMSRQCLAFESSQPA